MNATFFATPEDFRAWLEQHEEAPELLVGLRKKGSGRPSITWPEAVDEALCFGWIDGVRRRIDDTSYTIRYTPRRRGSTWSSVNIKRVGELVREGRIRPAGMRAFEARSEDRSGIYAYEQRHQAKPTAEQERQFWGHPHAWAFFQAQPPWYRQTATWWVVSAKRDDTKARRLRALIEDSEEGRAIRQFTRPGKSCIPR